MVHSATFATRRATTTRGADFTLALLYAAFRRNCSARFHNFYGGIKSPFCRFLLIVSEVCLFSPPNLEIYCRHYNILSSRAELRTTFTQRLKCRAYYNSHPHFKRGILRLALLADVKPDSLFSSAFIICLPIHSVYAGGMHCAIPN